MASHSFPKIDQKEYLKKYLSGNKVKKKKKDKKHKISSKDSVKVRIIDDDLNHLDTGLDIDEELLLTGEDAPQIVGEYIEENPSDRKVPKWKSIVIKDESDDDENNVTRQNDGQLWGRQASEMRIKQEYTIDNKRTNRTPDNSPARRKDRSRRSSSSPPRKHRRSPSPPRKSKRNKSPSNSRKHEDFSYERSKIKIEPQSPPFGKHGEISQKPKSRRDSSEAAASRRRRNTEESPSRGGHKGSSSDYSSPRRKRNFYESPSEKRKSPSRKFKVGSPARRRKDSDQTPPRRSESSDQSPPRRKANVSRYTNSRQRRNSDQSPPRKSRQRKETPDNSHATRGRKTPEPSHPRRKHNSDQSPQRKKRYSSDVSPPRKNRQRKQSPDSCKGRKTPDQSPQRRRRNSDQSTPRKTRTKYTTDRSPARRKRKSSGESRRNSPPIRIKQENQSPRTSPQPRPSRWERQESDKSLSPPPTHKPKSGKTLEGKKAGLQDAKALQQETLKRRKEEDLLFEKMSSNISGRNAEVQVRSTGRKGRRAREAAEEDPEERRRKEENEEKKKQQYDRWGKGLKQIEDHRNRMVEQEYESSKPLARYANDEDLERHLKEQERAEDPMLDYMRQKRKAKEKESGKPQVPRYEGTYPENRFGIRPGYRWDGVDRSNGYEKKYFDVQNEKRARQDEAYKYSVEDM